MGNIMTYKNRKQFRSAFKKAKFEFETDTEIGFNLCKYILKLYGDFISDNKAKPKHLLLGINQSKILYNDSKAMKVIEKNKELKIKHTTSQSKILFE